MGLERRRAPAIFAVVMLLVWAGAAGAARATGPDPFGAEAGSPIFPGAWPQAIATGDFNDDGASDLAIANRDGTIVTEINNGKGGFGLGPGSPIATLTSPIQIVVGTFTSSSNLDLAISDYSNNTITILLGDGQGDFTAPPGSPVTVPSPG